MGINDMEYSHRSGNGDAVILDMAAHDPPIDLKVIDGFSPERYSEPTSKEMIDGLPSVIHLDLGAPFPGLTFNLAISRSPERTWINGGMVLWLSSNSMTNLVRRLYGASIMIDLGSAPAHISAGPGSCPGITRCSSVALYDLWPFQYGASLLDMSAGKVVRPKKPERTTTAVISVTANQPQIEALI